VDQEKDTERDLKETSQAVDGVMAHCRMHKATLDCKWHTQLSSQCTEVQISMPWCR